MKTEEFWFPNEAETTRILIHPEITPDTLIVCCHGWHGGLFATWGNLSRIYGASPALAQTDIAFFGYSSSPASVDLLSSWLFDRVLAVFPEMTIKRGLRRKYSRLILVGHSLGTLAIRRGLVLLQSRRSAEANVEVFFARAKQLLYAPPLNGVDWKVFLDAVNAESIIGRFARVIQKAREQVGDDLSADSPFIKQLRVDTEKLHKTSQPFPSAHLVLAVQDRVIKPGRIEEMAYLGDTHVAINGHGHISVCKFSSDKDLRFTPLVDIIA